MQAEENCVPIGKIIITGNAKTKDEVIIREFPLQDSDTLCLSQIEKILLDFENNLLKTSLFNFVDTDYKINDNSVDILVSVEERWYFWPYPILEQADRNLSSFIHNRDFGKINYGIATDLYNVGGQNGTLKFKLRMGYKEHYSVAFHKNGIGMNRNSSLRFQVNYFRQKAAEYSTLDNKPLFASNDEKYLRNVFNTGMSYSYRPEINYRFNFGARYINSVFKSSLFFSEILPSDSTLKTNYFNPFFYFSYDSRNNKVYPVKGLFADVFFGEYRSLESQTGSYYTFSVSAQYNLQFGKSRFSYRGEPAFAVMKIFRNLPVLFDNKLDFSRDFWIRGYEYYYFTGPQYAKLQNTLGFKISDFRIHNLPSFLPKEFSKSYSRIFVDLFFDISRAESWNNSDELNNPMCEKWIYSTGIGLNLETYYDRLFQIYVAYISFSGKTGIFVNYKTPIYKLY